MLFNSDNGEELEFKVLGYQFPGNIEGDWDANWLRIYIRVISSMGNWRTVDPSLTTWELKQVINWLKAIGKSKKETKSELTFTEPNLSFQLVQRDEQAFKIRINFCLESMPRSATDDQDYFVEIILRHGAFNQAIRDLQIEYEKYPERRAK